MGNKRRFNWRGGGILGDKINLNGRILGKIEKYNILKDGQQKTTFVMGKKLESRTEGVPNGPNECHGLYDLLSNEGWKWTCNNQ